MAEAVSMMRKAVSRETPKAQPSTAHAIPKVHRAPTAKALPDLIEFAAHQIYCQEDEGTAYLEVTRQGACTGRSSVTYRTVDGSAKGGKRFMHTQGIMEFQPGERSKFVEVMLIQDDAFDTTLEFSVVLENPEGCVLGLYLWKANVLVMDDDSFPTNRFRDNLMKNNLRNVPRLSLMIEYYKFNLQDKSLRRAAIMNFIFDQFASVKFAWGLYLTNYMFDSIVRPSTGELPENHRQEICMFFVGMIIPELATFVLDRLKAKRRLSGKAINRLQANLLRKYMAYDEMSRHYVSTSDLVMAITRDVPDLVHIGFLNCLAVAQQAGLLTILIILNLYQNSAHSPIQTVVMTFAFPGILVLFFYLRHPESVRRRRAVFSAETKLVAYVKQATDNFRLFADYFQLSAAIDTFSGKVCALNDRNTDEMVWACVSENFTPALTTLFLLMYIGLNYQDAAATGTLPLGQFITGIGLWKSMGGCYQQFYFGMLQLQKAVSPLENIAFYMNLPVDVSTRMLTSRSIDEMNKQDFDEIYSWYATDLKESDTLGVPAHSVRPEVAERIKTLTSTENSVIAQELKNHNSGKPVDRWEAPLYPADLLCVYGRKITFSYPNSAPSQYVLYESDFTISQGKLVVVTGDRGGGKATFLDLLGGFFRPPTGQGTKFFVPPHCRVLHVGFDAVVIPEYNLWENLCFGPSDGDDEHVDRVLAICRQIGMSDRVLSCLKREAEEATGLGHSTSCGSILTFDPDDRDSHDAPAGTVESVVARELMEKRREEEGLLSQTDRGLIHIARALVMNPEIMVLHKPLARFDDFHGKVVLDMLREFVDQRGVHKNAETLPFRRPRSCIFSVSSTRGVEVADVVLHVGAGKVERIDVDGLQMTQTLGRELFEELDVSGGHRPCWEEFMSRSKTAKWSKELLGIDSSTDVNVVRERFRQIAGDSPFMDFGMLLRYLRKAKPDISPAVETGVVASASVQPNAGPDALVDCDPPDAAFANQRVAITSKQDLPTPCAADSRDVLHSSRWSHHQKANTERVAQSRPSACVAAVPPISPPPDRTTVNTEPKKLPQPVIANCNLFC